jgi:Ulp1 family protease
MGGGYPEVVRNIIRYIHHRACDESKPITKIRVRKCGNIPQQRDGINCGVFVCIYANCLSAEKDPNNHIKQSNVDLYRLHIASLLATAMMHYVQKRK